MPREVYSIDRSIILQKTYHLLCIIFSNKEIARLSKPGDVSDPLYSLEKEFFLSEVSRTLLEIAIAVRVHDDQMRSLPEHSLKREEYFSKLSQVINRINYTQFHFYGSDPTTPYTLRDICNKIIHANAISFERREGLEAHESDDAYRYGEGEKEISWDHLNGIIILEGRKGKDVWAFQLYVESFIVGVYKLIS